MIGFFITLWQFVTAIYSGFKTDDDFRVLLYLMVFLLFCSTLFYTQFEPWSIIDALYFSVITMSTIGYGDLAPTNDASKIFTMVFSFLSTGLFIAVNTKIVLLIVAKRKDYIEHKKDHHR